MTTGDRIRNRRIELGLTQEEVAQRLKLAGKSTVSKIEASGNNVSLKQVRKYAAALECTVGDLLGMGLEVPGPKVKSLVSKEGQEKIKHDAAMARQEIRKMINQGSKSIIEAIPEVHYDLPEINEPALTKRERLIQMILQMSDEQVDKLFEYSQFIQNKIAEG